MKKIAIAVVAGILALSTASAALADNPNWSAEKKAQVEQNRATNSGLGNGGERKNATTGEFEDKPQEVGTGDNPDLDPGNSGNQCQGGKNNEKNGDAC